MTVPIFVAEMLTVVSTAVVGIVWSEEFPLTHSRVLNLEYGNGYYAEIALGLLSLAHVFYLCAVFHWVEKSWDALRLRRAHSGDTYYTAI